MLRKVLLVNTTRLGISLLFSRSTAGAATVTSPNIVRIVTRKPVEAKILGLPRCRQPSKGFQSRLFAMTRGNSSTDGVDEVEPNIDPVEDDKYKNYRGLAILKFIGFEITELSATKSTGRFVVSENSCQPFNVLHGGTTAYIAESIASVSAGIAANFQRVAGIELTCSHLRSVPLGSEVEVTAVPLRVGKRIQVWEVKFETLKPENRDKSLSTESSGTSSQLVLAATSRVTLIVGLPIHPESKL